MRGWYNGCALGFQPRDADSISVPRSKVYTRIAQMVNIEQSLYK